MPAPPAITAVAILAAAAADAAAAVMPSVAIEPTLPLTLLYLRVGQRHGGSLATHIGPIHASLAR